MKKLALIPMGIALIGLWTDLHAVDKESDKSNGDAANTQAVFSWQTSPTTDGITHSDIGYPYAAFIVHTVGDVSKLYCAPQRLDTRVV
ncbi:hypothetical protein GX441_06505 [bacterium]|nr:hypothetical protein [bacterium]